MLFDIAYLYKLQVILCYNLENTTSNEPVTYDLDTSTVHQTGNTEMVKDLLFCNFMYFMGKKLKLNNGTWLNEKKDNLNFNSISLSFKIQTL